MKKNKLKKEQQKKKRRDNLSDNEKEQMKKEDNKRTKEKRDNLDANEEEQLKKYEKKGKKVKRDSLGDEEKEQIRENDNERKMDKLLQTLDERNNNAQMCSMTDPCILTTPAFRLIEQEFKDAIKECPTYICDICWKFEFRRNVIKLKETKYQADIYNECTIGKSDWICKSHDSISKNKIPMQAQVTNLELCSIFSELDRLCPIELVLISQIIPFMFIVAKTKRAQCGLKEQCVLVQQT